jgi:Txe/YoeB family toxin of Txe-Axe toxin-antitoxin module
MKIRPLRKDLARLLKRNNLTKKFAKQIQLFSLNSRHPSLHTEILEPKDLRIYSFRLDRQYRVIFVIHKSEIEIVDINNHYKK